MESNVRFNEQGYMGEISEIMTGLKYLTKINEPVW